MEFSEWLTGSHFSAHSGLVSGQCDFISKDKVITIYS